MGEISNDIVDARAPAELEGPPLITGDVVLKRGRDKELLPSSSSLSWDLVL